ncbi:MAG TPA: hypothetical protein VL282_06340 [Tepidisphaeraceae bacterium]|jgi:hypothetical protein|nr:hypothetical protein [Tepidisphaeraceae bacterium]
MTRKQTIASMLAGAVILGGCAAKKNKPSSSSEMQSHEQMAMEARMPEAVPAYANEVKSGKGPLSFQAQTPGWLYLVDADDNVLLYSGQLSKDQTFSVDPEARSATLDGKNVFTREIYPSHSHRLYFAGE